MKFKYLRVILTMIFAVFVVACSAEESPTVLFQEDGVRGAGSETKITILHTNDIHGRVEDGIGFARLATLVEQTRQENSNVLVLDAGDTVHGLPIATTFQGESFVRLMNAVGFDAMTAGNHDFNYGWERLVDLDQMADFPILAANVKDENGENILTSYVIKEIDDISIGIFGLSTPETAVKTHPQNVEGLTFESPIWHAQEMVDLLMPQVDIIIAIGHLGVDAESIYTSTRVIDEVDGIDLFIDGHSHTLFPTGYQQNDTLLVSAGEHLQHLGRVELVIYDGELIEATASVISVDDVEDVEENLEILAIIVELNHEIEELGSEIIGSTAVRLDGDRELVRTVETNLGNLIADVLLWSTGADIAITNGGGIRDSVEAGTIRVGDINRVFPFGNVIEVREVTGQIIKDVLEHGTRTYPEESGAFPQVSGLSFVIDVSRPVGDRVVEIMINGAPLELDGIYRLATNDFIGAGGDGFDMIEGTPLLTQVTSMSEALIDFIREQQGEIVTAVEGRITSR